MENDIHHLLGRYGEAIDHLKEESSKHTASLARIESTLAETRGGIKTLLGVGSIGGAIGAGAIKLLAMLKGGG